MKIITEYHYLILRDEFKNVIWILDVNNHRLHGVGSKRYFYEHISNLVKSLEYLYYKL